MLAFEPEVADAAIFSPLLDWWTNTLASTGRLPARSALRPEDLPRSTFSHLLLGEFVDGHADLLCHLIGDHIRSVVRRDWKGHRASDSAASAYVRDYLLPLYRTMARERRPIRTRNSLTLSGSAPVVLSRLIMPLCATDEDDAVRFVLGAICVHDSGAVEGDAWRDVVDHAELERIVL